ncbi:MAG: hypothetical protein HGGPFJEG_02105 [Ignavibacteria bacterium]|nr:hypothetical protein [Ignavibacteria bacterium]
MRLYLKLLLLMFFLAAVIIKLMLATESTADNNFKNKDLNTKSNGNYRLFRPEAGMKLGMQKLSNTVFTLHDNSCSMLY